MLYITPITIQFVMFLEDIISLFLYRKKPSWTDNSILLEKYVQKPAMFAPGSN